MKNLTTLLFTGILLILFFNQNSFSQNFKKQFHPKNPNSKKQSVTSSQSEKKFKKRIPGYSKNNSGIIYLLEENFESEIFPPAGWDNFSGSTVWNQANTSAFGFGDYCAYYDNRSCLYSNNDLQSPVITGSQTGDTILFDYAYAPYNDGFSDIYDDLEIYYSYDGGFNYYLLELIPCTYLQTAPATGTEYYPAPSEWGTYYIIMPDNNITNILFKSVENCGNNLFIDNIKISPGIVIPYTDIAVSAAYLMGRYPSPFLTNDTLSANIRNNGNQEVNNLKVYMQMTGANTYIDSAEVPAIYADENIVVNFKPFTPVFNGNSVTKVWIEAGDENIYNDTAYFNTNVNSNYFAYTDTVWNGFYGAIGFYDAVYILQKFRVTNANSRLTEVKLRIPDYGTIQVGQKIKGVILDENSVIKAKSEEYKIKASDIGTFVSLKITDPLPYYPLTNDSYFYAGGEYSDAVGENEYYWNATNQEEDPPRPGKYFVGVGILPVGQYRNLFEFGGRYGYEVKIENMPAVDAGISSMGNLYDQYYSTTTAPQSGKVFNSALSGTANATVIRKITPGGYTSSVPVSIPANNSVNVSFSDFTFTSGLEYTVRDSIVLTGDVNLSNNVKSGTFTPRIAKDLLFIYQKKEDKDSLLRSIIADGRYANNFDSVDLNYTGSLRPWKIIFDCTKSGRIILPKLRDSLTAFLDASIPANKKTLVVFGDNQFFYEYPNYASPADTVFIRQYMKSRFVTGDWLSEIPQSESKFKGRGFFDGVTQDSVGYPASSTLDLIRPVNGGSAAFIPASVAGSGSDSAVAVSYAGTNFNTFFMSNRFSDLRASSNSQRGPVLVYTKIIDWIQSINTGVKVLDLTLLIEGFYNSGTNSMTSDTVTVNIRSGASPFSLIESKKAYLNTSGIASLLYSTVSNGIDYHIQILHRNGLETWSRVPQSFGSNHMSYNFTSDSGKAYGYNMVKYGTKWVLYGGDVNQDGIIDGVDFSLVDNDAANFVTGYIETDVNGDGIVEGSDFAMLDNNSTQFISKVTPLSLIDNFSVNNDMIKLNANIYETGIISEFKIDHEIYKMFSNQNKNNVSIPDHVILSNRGDKKLIKNNNR